MTTVTTSQVVPARRRMAYAIILGQAFIVGSYVFMALIPYQVYGFPHDPKDVFPMRNVGNIVPIFDVIAGPIVAALLATYGLALAGIRSSNLSRSMRIALVVGAVAAAAFAVFHFTPIGSTVETWVLD